MKKKVFAVAAVLVVCVGLVLVANPFRSVKANPFAEWKRLYDQFRPSRVLYVTEQHLALLQPVFSDRVLAQIWDALQGVPGKTIRTVRELMDIRGVDKSICASLLFFIQLDDEAQYGW